MAKTNVSKKYKRTSTNITISIFYEQHCLGKYNYDPAYQRDYNVWAKEQQSFLIDTILKNYPMPAVFLEQKIVDGKTYYDVIDGKQRLNTIISFIDDKVTIPKDFGNDIYGADILNGLTFEEFKKLAEKNSVAADYLDAFWGYALNIEYIEKPSEKIVDNIFDRLNRGGERLNPAELRKAKYYDTIAYRGIADIATKEKVNLLLSHLDYIRLENISFITELYILVYTQTIINGVERDIDKEFEKIIKGEITDSTNLEIEKLVLDTVDILFSYDLDFEKYRIKGTSHLYALFYISLYFLVHKITVDAIICEKLVDFFDKLRSHDDDDNVMTYMLSMQSASKFKASRRRRIAALLGYLGYENISIKIPKQK